jgi:SAM-dependent methyltransferase
MSWGIGRFERIAPVLLPASEASVARLDVRAGERVLDLGCGSGNATELLARAGADVIAVDPAARLLDVARRRLVAAGLGATFLDGTAGEIPLADASVDAIVSVFAMVFAPDPDGVIAEVHRVLRRPGRLIFTAWIPEGAMFEVSADRRRAVDGAAGPTGQTLLAWHDPAAVADALAPYGFDVSGEERELAFTASSPDDYVDVELAEHPMWVLARSALPPADWELLQDRARAMFRDANEDPSGFRVTSRYVVITAERGD